MNSKIPGLFDMAKAKVEAQRAMKLVIDCVADGEPVDPEHLVVIRGSSELFAELAETYISVRGTQ